MSHHKSIEDLPEGGEFFDESKAALLKTALGFVGGICFLATMVLIFAFGRGDSEAAKIGDWASYSYLFAIIFYFTLGVGGLFWTILHHATNSGWGIVVRRQMENIAGLVPWIFILMLPFWFSEVRSDLWEWEPEHKVLVEHAESGLAAALEKERSEWQHEKAQFQKIADDASKLLTDGNGTPGELAALQEQSNKAVAQVLKLDANEPDEASVMQHLRHHENPLLAMKWDMYFHASKLRLGLYTFIFILIVWLLRNWSIRTDKEGGEKLFRRSRYWSCFFLLPFSVGFTFLVIDFLMTMNYEWFSTMWGVYLFAGAALNSMALLIIVVTALRNHGYLKEVVSMEHYHLMGKLLLAFCVFWAYIAFSQYFLIWYANITEETRFYLLRNSDWWNVASIVLVVGHFFIPFVILLWQPIKKRPHLLSLVAVWCLLMHILDIYWIVIAERGPSLTVGDAPQLFFGKALVLDILAFLGVGGILGYIFIINLKRASLYPCRDPRLAESVNVTN